MPLQCARESVENAHSDGSIRIFARQTGPTATSADLRNGRRCCSQKEGSASKLRQVGGAQGPQPNCPSSFFFPGGNCSVVDSHSFLLFSWKSKTAWAMGGRERAAALGVFYWNNFSKGCAHILAAGASHVDRLWLLSQNSIDLTVARGAWLRRSWIQLAFLTKRVLSLTPFFP